MATDRGAARRAWIRALEAVAATERDPTLTLAAMLDGLAERYADRPALLLADRTGEGGELTYRDLARTVRQVALWALAQPAGVIGLLMPSRPETVAYWLGLTRAGRTVALLNPNLTGDLLRHAIETAACALVIADDVLAPALDSPITCSALSAALPMLDGALPPPPAPADTALLLFTSGTTGLPKAARVSHARILEWGLWFGGMIDLAPTDRIYDCLPLYHSTGGIVAIAAALVRGASVLIAPGFSASRFWDEVAVNECTIFFYIGELCRYLTNIPAPTGHSLRLAVGNGLHGSVWEHFQDHCAIPQILEFYAATEGSISLYNCEGRPGAIGRIPPFLQARFPLVLAAIDPETGEPRRDKDGRCVICGPDEPGEALGRLDVASSAAARRFDGYTDPAASERKVVRDVIQPGDSWFRSGDLMRRDAAGFLYFLDRMGDTFRWKGENVSTGEVAAVIRGCPGVADAVVFGVRVPGEEGRAGMAALVAGPGFDLEILWSYVTERLPTYAQPVFIRLCGALDMTGTFKLSTARLQREALEDTTDPLWRADRAASAYVPLNGGDKPPAATAWSPAPAGTRSQPPPTTP